LSKGLASFSSRELILKKKRIISKKRIESEDEEREREREREGENARVCIRKYVKS